MSMIPTKKLTDAAKTLAQAAEVVTSRPGIYGDDADDCQSLATLAHDARILRAADAIASGYWWCPKCRSYVSWETVTHEECHEPCGAYLGGSVQEDHRNATTPPPGLAGIGRDELARTLFEVGFPSTPGFRWEVLRSCTLNKKYMNYADAILARIAGRTT
jgi:hypothetical protein